MTLISVLLFACPCACVWHSLLVWFLWQRQLVLWYQELLKCITVTFSSAVAMNMAYLGELELLWQLLSTWDMYSSIELVVLLRCLQKLSQHAFCLSYLRTSKYLEILTFVVTQFSCFNVSICFSAFFVCPALAHLPFRLTQSTVNQGIAVSINTELISKTLRHRLP